MLYIRPAFWHQEESRNLLANDGMSKGWCHLQLLACIGEQFYRGRGDLWSGGQRASKAGQALHVDKVSKQRSSPGDAESHRSILRGASICARSSCPSAQSAPIAKCYSSCICLWAIDAPHMSSPGLSLQVSIGKQLKQVLDIDSSIRIGYLVHVSSWDAPRITPLAYLRMSAMQNQCPILVQEAPNRTAHGCCRLTHDRAALSVTAGTPQ